MCARIKVYLILLAYLSVRQTNAVNCPSRKCQCMIVEVASRMETQALCNQEQLGFVPIFKEFSTPISKLQLDKIRLTALDNNTFTKLTSVKKIYFNDNMIRKIDSAAFAGIDTSLELIDLQHNSLSELSFLRTHNFTNLRELVLRDNLLLSIHPDSLSRLPSLELLNLDDNGLSDPLLFLQQPQLKALSTLNIDANQLTSVDPADFFYLSNLQVLLLNRNRIRDVDFLYSQKFKQLRGLSLSNNKITSIERQLFDRNTKLRWLDLTANKISDVSFLLSCGLIHLEELYLANNLINFIPKEALQVTYQLTTLDLQNNQLTTIPQCTLSRFYTRMETFNIEGNPLVCNCSLSWLQQAHQILTEKPALCSNIEFESTVSFDINHCKKLEVCTKPNDCEHTNKRIYYSAVAASTEDTGKALSTTITNLLLILTLVSLYII